MAFIGMFSKYVIDMVNHFDEAVYSFLSVYISESCTKLMTVITHMGSSYTLTLIAVIIFLAFGVNRQFSVYSKYVIYNLVLTWVVNEILKVLFQRERPDVLHLIAVNGYSFPSGHAMISMSFYGLLIYIFLRHLHSKCLRVCITAVFGLLIFFIGLSRVYLGVHYASDVIAGFVIGIIWLKPMILCMNWFCISKYSSNI